MLTAILFVGHGESKAWALDDVEKQQNMQQMKEKVVPLNTEERFFYSEFVKRLSTVAEQGDVQASSLLGGMYYEGKVIPQDYAKAFKWYLKAVEQGSVKDQAMIGVMYYDGKGVPQDYAEAFKWYRKVAEQGNVKAQSMLGAMYYQGKGIPQDFAEAYFWFNLATASGVTNIAKLRDRAAKKLSNETLRKVQQRASNWQPKK